MSSTHSFLLLTSLGDLLAQVAAPSLQLDAHRATLLCRVIASAFCSSVADQSPFVDLRLAGGLCATAIRVDGGAGATNVSFIVAAIASSSAPTSTPKPLLVVALALLARSWLSLDAGNAAERVAAVVQTEHKEENFTTHEVCRDADQQQNRQERTVVEENVADSSLDVRFSALLAFRCGVDEASRRDLAQSLVGAVAAAREREAALLRCDAIALIDRASPGASAWLHIADGRDESASPRMAVLRRNPRRMLGVLAGELDSRQATGVFSHADVVAMSQSQTLVACGL